MPAVDTNVLVRLIVQDDVAQQAAACYAIATVVDAGETVHIPTTVVLELEWVLRSRYRFSREEIEQTMVGLLASDDVDVGNELAVEDSRTATIAGWRRGVAERQRSTARGHRQSHRPNVALSARPTKVQQLHLVGVTVLSRIDAERAGTRVGCAVGPRQSARIRWAPYRPPTQPQSPYRGSANANGKLATPSRVDKVTSPATNGPL